MVDWRDGIAGGVSGVTTRFFVAPLDVIKIRLQLQVISKDSISKASHVKYQGVLQTLGLLVREEGVLALWKGNMTAEFLWGGYMASQFFTYRACQGIFDEHRSRQTLSHSMVAGDMMCGGIAGGIATVVTYPFDLIRTRLAAQPEPKVYSGLRQAAQQIVEQEGFAGLYRGLTPAFVAVVPYMGIQFAVYESLKRYFRQRERASPYLPQSHKRIVVALDTSSGEKRGNVLEHLLCGCAAGSISKLSTLPLDVTKKRMQVSGAPKSVRQQLQPSYVIKSSLTEPPHVGHGGLRGGGGGGAGRSTMLQTVAVIFSVEGVPGFFRGGYPSVIKTALSSGLSFTFYEICSQSLKSS